MQSAGQRKEASKSGNFRKDRFTIAGLPGVDDLIVLDALSLGTYCFAMVSD